MEKRIIKFFSLSFVLYASIVILYAVGLICLTGFLYIHFPTYWKIVHVIIMFLFVVGYFAICAILGIITRPSNKPISKSEQIIRNRCDKEQMKIMIESCAIAGVLSIFAKPVNDTEILLLTSGIICFVLIIGLWYRFLCKEGYQLEESTKKEKWDQLISTINSRTQFR